ncbi:MAG: hypothetical protein KR126chlam5_00203 [Candidatus Anoxychlamydiales bacterium]|nr:hypothetical protein [Candidatus Anoxychlamydiales bacterium]
MLITVLASAIAFAEDIYTFRSSSWEKPKGVAPERQNFSYVAIGGLIPNLTYGHRITVRPNLQIDVSGGFSTIIKHHSFDVTLKGLLRYKESWYIGGGVKGETVYSRYIKFKGIYSVLTHGWDTSKDFKEISVIFPFSKTKGLSYKPSISVKYGWKL